MTGWPWGPAGPPPLHNLLVCVVEPCDPRCPVAAWRKAVRDASDDLSGGNS